MPVFTTPTKLRLTSSGVVNLDFLTADNTARLVSGGIIGNGMTLGGGSLVLTLPLVGVEAAVYSPMLIQPQVIGLPQVTVETAVLNFSLELGPQFIGLPLVTTEALVYDFELAIPKTLELNLVDSTASVYAMFIHIPGTQIQYEGIYYYGD